jgi:preprotein translocase subunit SecG
MVQNPKGGGLSSSFGGGGTQQMGGVQKTTDFLDKSTWTLGGLLLVLILLSSIPLMSSVTSNQSAIKGTDQIPLQAPATPDPSSDATTGND